MGYINIVPDLGHFMIYGIDLVIIEYILFLKIILEICGFEQDGDELQNLIKFLVGKHIIHGILIFVVVKFLLFDKMILEKCGFEQMGENYVNMMVPIG